jgi:AcrR family transcriptional regulator
MVVEEKHGKNRERLTRERVIEAALKVMDTEGLEAVSMRRVAREVGVEAMSLYHHVRDKEDLLQGICDLVMASFEFPDESGEWMHRTKAGAYAWRHVLQAHPDLMRLFAENHGPAPMAAESLKPTELALGLLREAGLSDRETVMAFHAFGGYIQGFVMMESGSIKGELSDMAAISPEAFPVLASVCGCWGEIGGDEQFEFGLDLLIRGLQARVAATSAGG